MGTQDIFTLRDISGMNDKIDFIKKHDKDQWFTKVLYYAINPMLTYNISEATIRKKIKEVELTKENVAKLVGWTDKNNIKSVFDLFDYLNAQRGLDNKTIEMVALCLKNINETDRELYIQIISKTLKLGVSVKGINKAIPGLIPTLDVMLANKYFDHMNKVTGDFTITEKLDGFRCVGIVRNGNIDFFSRQGKKILGLTEIKSEIENMKIDNVVFDGELVSSKFNEVSSKENYKMVSKIVSSDEEKKDVCYCIFDILSYQDFISQTCTVKYKDRRKKLDGINDTDHAKVLPVLYQGSDKENIMIELNKAKRLNKEGVMINLDNSMYEFRRTNSLLKVKVMQDADLKVKSVYEGTGKNAGKLGGVVVEFTHKDKVYECNCGSGFDDDERVKYWRNPSEIIGKIVTIQYFEITKNKEGGYGLRFPVWTHRIRYDKAQISMN